MADSNQERQELMESMRSIVDGFRAAIADQIRATQDSAKSVGYSGRNFSVFGDSVKEATRIFGQLDAEVSKGRRRWGELHSELEDLADTIKSVSDTEKRNQLEQQLILRRQQANDELRRQLINNIAVSSAQNLAKGTETVLSKYQSGADAITAGTAVLEGVVHAVTGVIGVVGDAISKLPVVGDVGVALKNLSAGLDRFASAVLNFLSNELSNLVKGFQAASNAGVIFARGLDSFRQHGVDAGLTMAQFAKVIVENKDNFITFGGSMSEATRKFGDVSRLMAGDVRKKLLSLGYTIDDIAAGTAEYMALQVESGQAGIKTAAQLAAGTERYLTNLRIISDFTGKDAKRMQEEAAASSRKLAIGAELRGLGSDAMEKYKSLFSLLPDKLMQQALEQKLLGGPVTGEAAIVMSANQPMEQALNEMVQLIRSGGVDVNQALDQAQGILVTRSKDIADASTNMAGSIGRAAEFGGKYGNVAASLASLGDFGRRLQQIGTQNIRDFAEGSKNANDNLTKAYTEMTDNWQKIQMRVVNSTQSAVDTFAKAINLALGTIEKGLGLLGIGGPLVPAAPPAASGPGPVVSTPSGQQGYVIGEGETLIPIGPNLYSKMVTPDLKSLGAKPTAGQGPITPQLNDVLPQLINQIPGAYITGLNDDFGPHMRDKDVHKKGRAVDFTIKGYKKEDWPKYEKILKGLGFSYLQNEYDDPSTGSSGGHIHASFAKGGITNGLSLAGEAGPEAIVPLPDGRTIPVSMDNGALIAKLDQLISIMSSQAADTRKMLNVLA
jgi:hypothetical protein